MNNPWKYATMFLIAMFVIGGVGWAYMKWSGFGKTGLEQINDEFEDTSTDTTGLEKALARTIDTAITITMSDQIRAGTSGAVDARYDYWICKENGEPSKSCGTDNDDSGWVYVTGSAAQAAITQSPGDWLMFLVGDDGDANCDTTDDWYKEIFFYEVPPQETDQLNFALCKEDNITVSITNSDGATVNSRSNAQALAADEEKQLTLQVTGGTTGCFGSPSEHAGVPVKMCFAVNGTTTDKVYLSGAGIDDESAPVPSSEVDATDWRDESDWCTTLDKNYIGRNEVLRYTLIIDTDGTTQPTAHNSNVTLRPFDGDGFRDKYTGLPVIDYNNASDNDIGIGTVRQGSDSDTIAVS